MTDKLYSEEAVQDIADAIREKNGSAETYTVSQMGTAVRGIQTGVDTSDATATADEILYGKTAYVSGGKAEGTCHYKEYVGEIVSTVIGTNTYAELAEDVLLAEIRDEETLFVWVEFDIEPTPYTVKKTYAFNRAGMILGWGSATATCQYIHRYDDEAGSSPQIISYPINNFDDSNAGIGRIYITEEGKLLCTANSNNYGIRPGNYTIRVVW